MRRTSRNSSEFVRIEQCRVHLRIDQYREYQGLEIRSPAREKAAFKLYVLDERTKLTLIGAEEEEEEEEIFHSIS